MEGTFKLPGTFNSFVPESGIAPLTFYFKFIRIPQRHPHRGHFKCTEPNFQQARELIGVSAVRSHGQRLFPCNLQAF